jgi:hypothetical protein
LGAGSSDTILKGDHPKAPSILPNLVPIDPVVSEENIKIQKVNDGRTDGRRTPSGSKCSHDPSGQVS